MWIQAAHAWGSAKVGSISRAWCRKLAARLERLPVEPGDQVERAQHRVIGRQRLGRLAQRALELRVPDAGRDARDRVGDDLVLHGEDVADRDVHPVGPDRLAAAGVAELDPDAQLAARAADASGHEVAHAERTPDVVDPAALGAQAERRSARDHRELMQARERQDDVLHDAVGEVALVGLAVVGERQHRDRRTLGQGQGRRRIGAATWRARPGGCRRGGSRCTRRCVSGSGATSSSAFNSAVRSSKCFSASARRPPAASAAMTSRCASSRRLSIASARCAASSARGDRPASSSAAGQRHGGVERQRIEPALLRPRPGRPLLVVGQRDIGEERSGIELQRLIEGLRRDQPLERRDVAVDEAGPNPDAVAAAHDRILSEDAAQTHQRLAQALLRLGLGTGSPQQRHHRVARLRLGPAQTSQASRRRQLARAELDPSRRACEPERAEQPQAKPEPGHDLRTRRDVEHQAFRLLPTGCRVTGSSKRRRHGAWTLPVRQLGLCGRLRRNSSFI